MFSVQPQRNNDRRETSESAGQNKSKRQTIRIDGSRCRRAADSHCDIRRQQTVQRLENQPGVLEDDSFADREPMKLLQDRSDVVLALHA